MYITILLPLFTMMSFIFFIPVVTRRVVQEKASGVKVFINISVLYFKQPVINFVIVLE